MNFMNSKLLEKSINSRNLQAFQALANLEALKAWGNTPNDTRLPKYEKPKVQPLSAGIYNLVRQILP